MACSARFQDHIADGIYATLIDPDKYRLQVFRLFVAQKQCVYIKRVRFCENLHEPLGVFKNQQSRRMVIDRLLEKAEATKQLKLKFIQKQINQKSWVPPEVWAATSREEKEIIIKNKNLKLKEISVLSEDPNLESKTIAHVERVINAPNFTSLPTLTINPYQVKVENSVILNQNYVPGTDIQSVIYSAAEQNGIDTLASVYNMNNKIKLLLKPFVEPELEKLFYAYFDNLNNARLFWGNFYEAQLK